MAMAVSGEDEIPEESDKKGFLVLTGDLFYCLFSLGELDEFLSN
jgi:hypothetical protein